MSKIITIKQFYIVEGIKVYQQGLKRFMGDDSLSDLHLTYMCGRCTRQMGVGERNVCVLILGIKLSMQHRKSSLLWEIS